VAERPHLAKQPSWLHEVPHDPTSAPRLRTQRSRVEEALGDMNNKFSLNDIKSWLGHEWGPRRRQLARILATPAFEWSMSVVISISIIFVILDVDNNAAGHDSPHWLQVCNIIVMVVYFFDVCIRLYVFRLKYFYDPFRVFDFLVISADIIMTLTLSISSADIPVPSTLSRIGRVMRVGRALRMMAVFPQLGFMLKGMMFAAKSLVWGVLMLFMVICFWSILAVVFINPLVKEMHENLDFWAGSTCAARCPHAFESVAMAMLTFCQQLVVGEGWGDINTPVMEKYPSTVLFFMLVLVSTNLAVLNMLLGVIVERATEAKNVTNREEAAKKDREFDDAARHLYHLCTELDTDQSGRITFAEFEAGFEDNPEFADILRVMDIDREDLEVVFSMLDVDRSGDVAYEEFVEQLHNMKSRESHTLLIFIKFYVMEIKNRVYEALPAGGFPTGAFDHFKTSRTRSRLWGGDKNAKRPSREKALLDSSPLPSPRPTANKDALTAEWAEIESELQKQIANIGQELVDFSRTQGERLDLVQQRLSQTSERPSGCQDLLAGKKADDVPKKRDDTIKKSDDVGRTKKSNDAIQPSDIIVNESPPSSTELASTTAPNSQAGSSPSPAFGNSVPPTPAAARRSSQSDVGATPAAPPTPQHAAPTVAAIQRSSQLGGGTSPTSAATRASQGAGGTAPTARASLTGPSSPTSAAAAHANHFPATIARTAAPAGAPAREAGDTAAQLPSAAAAPVGETSVPVAAQAEPYLPSSEGPPVRAKKQRPSRRPSSVKPTK